VSHAPGLNHITRMALHLAPQRQIPRLSNFTFQHLARKNGIPAPGELVGNTSEKSATGIRELILWADTFNNYFHPETSQAAFEVLTSAGFGVSVPRQHLCCGRPLYDFGMLDAAKSYLQRILDELAPQIDAGVPMVVLEPSCASVFRD